MGLDLAIFRNDLAEISKDVPASLSYRGLVVPCIIGLFERLNDVAADGILQVADLTAVVDAELFVNGIPDVQQTVKITCEAMGLFDAVFYILDKQQDMVGIVFSLKRN